MACLVFFCGLAWLGSKCLRCKSAWLDMYFLQQYVVTRLDISGLDSNWLGLCGDVHTYLSIVLLVCFTSRHVVACHGIGVNSLLYLSDIYSQTQGFTR